MAESIRAGGHIIGPSGWQPEHPPTRSAAAAAEQPDATPAADQPDEMSYADPADDTSAADVGDGEVETARETGPDPDDTGEQATEDDSGRGEQARATDDERDDEAGPRRAECPDCGKSVVVNKNGTLRKHTCVVDAAPPQVTFEEGD